MLPAVGTLSALNSGGRLGVAVDPRPLAEPAEGRQLAALGLRTVDGRDAQGHAARVVSGLAPLPTEAGERPATSRRSHATREHGAVDKEQRSTAEQEVTRRHQRAAEACKAEIARTGWRRGERIDLIC